MSAYLRSSQPEILPVSATDVASVVCGNSANVDNYTENNEADTSEDLHDTEDEFNLFCQP